MREIKFRAWDINGKGFVNGFNMFGFSKGQGAPKRKLQRFNDEWQEGDFILMQSTGLKDKNGKEIYEGDILNHRTYVRSNIFRRGVVCFDENQCTYKFVPHEAFESNAGNGGWSGFAFDHHICQEAEIVGNIYENPDLLAVMDS